MENWKDVTSYARGQDRTPTAFQLEIGDFDIIIVRTHIYHPGKWIITCTPFFCEEEFLPKETDADLAKATALQMIREKINEVTKLLEAI